MKQGLVFFGAPVIEWQKSTDREEVVSMLYAEREKLIMQQLQLQSTVGVSSLSRMMQVSVDTVCRDLKNMEQKGMIRVVRGGACLPETMSMFQNFYGRKIINSDLKREASRKALALVQKDDLIALNSGTTNTIFAQELVALDFEFTVVTNNQAALNVLINNPKIHIIAIGGDMDASECSSYGAQCLEEFSHYYPDKAFLSINAVNYEDEFTDFRLNEIPVIQTLAGNAKKVIVVMDTSKLGKCSKKDVLHFDQVDRLIMDDHVDEKIREKYRTKGIEIE